MMNEMFEYAKAVGATTKDLKDLLLRNVDAMFDEECKDWVRSTIEKFSC